MARHEALPTTFDAVVSDYVTGRAKELIRQFDQMQGQIVTQSPSVLSPAFKERLIDLNEWVGAAAEILRELTRDA